MIMMNKSSFLKRFQIPFNKFLKSSNLTKLIRFIVLNFLHVLEKINVVILFEIVVTCKRTINRVIWNIQIVRAF